MKVKITHTVEIDPEKWWVYYGTARSEIRADAVQYFRSLINDQIARIGVGPGVPSAALSVKHPTKPRPLF